MIKLVSYNCNSIRNNAEIVKSLLDNTDVLCLQEIMLHQRDIDILNDFHDDFKSFTFVKPVEEDVIREGRPSGGVSIFWRKYLSPFIKPFYIDDRVLGIIFEFANTKLLILNVYMPCDYQNYESLD